MSAPVVINRYAISNSPAAFDIMKAKRVTIKHCEGCGLLHVTEAEEAKYPGDLLAMQRAAGRRAPILCGVCVKKPTLTFVRAETATMLEVAAEVRRARDIKQTQDEERVRFRKPREVMHESKNKERRRRPRAKWMSALVLAFKENEYMTARQIAAVMSAAGSGVSSAQNGVYTARNAGLPIVKSDRRVENKSMCGRRFVALFTLSSNPDPTPLTPPQDPVTHQFMKEVRA